MTGNFSELLADCFVRSPQQTSNPEKLLAEHEIAKVPLHAFVASLPTDMYIVHSFGVSISIGTTAYSINTDTTKLLQLTVAWHVHSIGIRISQY